MKDKNIYQCAKCGRTIDCDGNLIGEESLSRYDNYDPITNSYILVHGQCDHIKDLDIVETPVESFEANVAAEPIAYDYEDEVVNCGGWETDED